MARVTASSAAEAVRVRLRRTTGRERVLLAGLALAALTYLPIAAHGWAQAQVAGAGEDEARLQAATAADDGARLRGVEARIAALEGKARALAPAAPSFPVARVLVEQEVALAAAQAGLKGLDVRAAETPDRIGALSFVRVEVESGFGWPGFASMLRRLADVRPGYVVERAAAEGEGEGARLRLVLLAPFAAAGRA